MHPQDDSAFRFKTRQQRAKTVNFDVCKNRLKSIGYHSPLDYCETYVIFTARGYAKRGICRRRVSVCLCVCVCVCALIASLSRNVTEYRLDDMSINSSADCYTLFVKMVKIGSVVFELK